MLSESDKKIIKLRIRETHKIMDRKAEQRRRGDVKHVQFFVQKDSTPVNERNDWYCPECGTMNHAPEQDKTNPFASGTCLGCGKKFLLDF